VASSIKQEEKLKERAARVLALKYAPHEVHRLLAKPPLERKNQPKIETPKSCFAGQSAS